MDGRDSAEFKALIRLTPDLQLAVKTQLTPLGGELVAVDLITSDDYAWLINPHQRKDNQAAYLIQLIQQKVQQNPLWYQTFIAVLEKDQSQYGGIIRDLQHTVQRFRLQQSVTAGATPSITPSPSSAPYASTHYGTGRELYV